jgi:flagellar export protein FliJ
MPPKFSLQTVLDVRHSKVEALEIELSKLLMAQQEKEALLESLKGLQRNLQAQLQEQQQGEMDLFFVRHLYSNLEAIRQAMEQVEAYLAELTGQIEAKRQEVVTAKQAEESLGILKTREIERYQADQAQKENRFQDDIYIARVFHQRHQEA